MKIASRGRRWGAAVVELVVLYAVHMLALVIVVTVAPHAPADRPLATALAVAVVALGLLAVYGCTEIIGDGSPSKRAFGLRVRSTSGARVPRRALVRRWLMKTIPFSVWFGVGLAIALGAARGQFWTLLLLVVPAVAGLVVGALDFLPALGPTRQAFHDRNNGAVIVKADGP
jgi:hypothetical protein